MRVRGQLRNVQSVRVFAALLAQSETVASVVGNASLEIGQREVGLPVAAICGAKQGKQGLVLVDRQQLAVAQRPALGGEIKAYNLDFRQKRGRHCLSLVVFPGLDCPLAVRLQVRTTPMGLCWGRKDSEQGNDEIDAQIGR